MLRPRKKAILGSMQRRDILTGRVAALGNWATGSNRARGADSSTTLSSATLLKVPMSDGASIALEKIAMYAAPDVLAAAISDFLSA